MTEVGNVKRERMVMMMMKFSLIYNNNKKDNICSNIKSREAAVIWLKLVNRLAILGDLKSA